MLERGDFQLPFNTSVTDSQGLEDLLRIALLNHLNY